MKSVRILATVVLAAGMVFGAMTAAVGQEPVADACPAGSRVQGDIGISGLECTQCSFSFFDDGTTLWSFRAEPIVRGVRGGSPADGALRAGDVIVAIDGVLITTKEGGRRYANIKPADTVELTVRRGRETMMVGLIASARCARMNVAPAAPAAPAAEVAPVPDVAPVPFVPPPDRFPLVAPGPAPRPDYPLRGLFPSGRFGFGIRCNCEVHAGSSEEAPVWKFREPPEVYSVEGGGPADEAGLRHGDELLELDGVSITSDEGGRRFGAIKAGDTVTFRYRRGGTTRDVTLTAQERPARSAPPARTAEAAELIRQLTERRAQEEAVTQELLTQLAQTEEADSQEVEELRQRLEVERQAQHEAQTELQTLLEEVERARAVPGPEYLILDQLRFAGVVGNVEVEVRGASSVIVTVVQEGKEIVIITRDARIRIRLPEH